MKLYLRTEDGFESTRIKEGDQAVKRDGHLFFFRGDESMYTSPDEQKDRLDVSTYDTLSLAVILEEAVFQEGLRVDCERKGNEVVFEFRARH